MTRPRDPHRGAAEPDGVVCLIRDAEYPWDVRVEKMCRSLTSAGWKVHVVARNRDRRPQLERLEECSVHRLKPWRRMGSRIDAASQFPAFFNPRWYGLIRRAARATGAHVLFVRDLPLAPTAVWAGARLGLPVVLDMAENYPEMIRDLWSSGGGSLLNLAVRNPRLVSATERWVLRRVARIIVVVEESRERLVSLGVPEDRITVVSNTPPLARLHDGRACTPAHGTHRAEADGRRGHALEAVYLGFVEQNRGIATAIDAIAECRRGGSDVRLSVIGDGRDLEAMKSRIGSRGPTDGAVRFLGRLPHDEALARVAAADVGLIPHHATAQCHTTVPNKLFDYMCAGLPVVSSDMRPVRRILSETGAGMIFRDRDAAELASRFRTLLSMSDGGKAMGEAGRRAVAGRYNWESDERRLLSTLAGASGA